MNLDEPRESEIHEQVKRIVTSGAFSGSERLCRFLTWTVEQTLQGQAQNIKSYTVGLEVFDRGENFDPRVDSIVRTEAVRLRRKLAEYYKSDGASDPILISFTPGSYAPSFQLRRQGLSTVVRTRPGQRHGVAVVPFVNLTGDPQQEHFCRGIGATIQEHLMARDFTVFSVHLAPVDWFSCDFVQQARDLGVEKIVTGGVRETESMVRVHVRVIDAETGAYILARSFDRKKEDALAINDEVAQVIAEEMTEKPLRRSASTT